MVDGLAASATSTERVEQLGLPALDALLELGKSGQSIFDISVRDFDKGHVLGIRLGKPSRGILQAASDPRMLLDLFECDALGWIFFEATKDDSFDQWIQFGHMLNRTRWSAVTASEPK